MTSRALAAVLTAGALALTACGAKSPAPGDGDAEGLRVAAAFYPLAHAAELAGGDAVAVSNLTTPGTEAHDLELSPQQIVALTEADVVVYLAGFQPAVDDAIAQSGAQNVIEVSEVARLTEHAADEPGHADEGHEDEGHEDEGHDHGEADPHFWLDPTRLADVVEAISEELAAVSPEDSEAFKENAVRSRVALVALDEEFATGLAECERREIFVSHAAFGYLTERYDLEQVAVVGLTPHAEPSPARIAEVQELAREHGATTIFFESQASDAVADSIAGDLGLRTAVLDPLESLTEESAGEDYSAVMRANLQAIRDANGCS
ncbi:zinc ABC transporter substrate-binding protein [Tessaracoccus rhinocerotis]|uniref:Zinc ABC transporter substrate-binding protein n=1 Tax=Tessaracoccus rhinocerotis TaxID=1689449 RepID=A0A553K482_9ACTN|nr:metal ABC transporter substrate-binding protein [Tessaracoccus rhinocerotis]TRY19501.1 zinc ABC transporter substrate-binding protein [Tessaracoccus rhinocerotis]